MARTESIFAAHDGGAPGAWTSVLTPGFLTARSVRDDARLGNPGHRGGPEDHAPGVRATGRLGLDLARMALRRTHHLVTRLPELDAGRWAEPAAGTGTVAGAVLQNIAEIVESPELALIPEAVVHSLSNDWAGLISTLSPLLPPALASLASAVPAPAAGDRWVNEVKRDAFAAKHGRRDSQWAWRWAIAHARTLIYAETPLLGATGSGTGEQAVDLVALLIARLAAAPDLRVIIATPRRVPFGPGYEGFAQRHYLQRNAAVDALVAAAPKRVVVYHPVGFPGRPEVLRGVFGVVDDVWAIAGSSSLSRRGLTFDGSVDVAWLDRQLREGTSAAVREMRRRALARTLGVTPPTAGETPNANWVRTLQPRSAFELMREILERGGDGLIEPLWRGLPESEVLALDARIADPEGRDFPAVLGLFAQVLAGLGDNRV